MSGSQYDLQYLVEQLAVNLLIYYSKRVNGYHGDNLSSVGTQMGAIKLKLAGTYVHRLVMPVSLMTEC